MHNVIVTEVIKTVPNFVNVKVGISIIGLLETMI